MKLSKRLQSLGESATMAVAQRAKALKAQGSDLIDLAAGQLHFDTPPHIREAAKRALDEGHTGYPLPVAGLDSARKAVCRKFKRDDNLDYSPEQVIITVGGKEALYLGFVASLNEGDEVIVPAPYWVSYPDQIILAGARPVFVQGNEANHFRITAEQLEGALTGKTRIVVMNYPCNPGGFQYSHEELLALAEVLKGRDVIVFSDEMYDRLTYGEQEHISWASLSPETYEKTVTINAVSKTYSMTGWRMGYAAGPADLIQAMAKLKGQISSGVVNFNQYALVEALTGDQSCVDEIMQEMFQRRQAMYDGLNALPGVSCIKPTGSIYYFPNVSGTYQKLRVDGSVAFAKKVLDEAHVTVVPGIAFGSDDHVRMTFSTTPDRIHLAMSRIAELLDKNGTGLA